MSQNWRQMVMAFLADAEAAVGSEHALLLALIAMAIFVAVQEFGLTVWNKLWAVAGTLPLGR